MRSGEKQVLEFGPFRLDADERSFTCSGDPVHLTPKAFDSLLLLVRNHGHLVDKRVLMETVWPHTFVEEGNLAQHISALRKLLHDREGAGKYIETVPRYGYRFVAEVRELLVLTNGQHASPEPIIGKVEPVARELRIQPKLAMMLLLIILVVIVAAGILSSRLSSHKAPARIETAKIRNEAEKNYLEGRFFWEKRTDSGYRAAIAHFEEAVKLNPDYSEAYAGLANSYILLGSFGIEPLGEVIPKARAAALRAIELKEQCAEAHAAIAYIMSRFDWNWSEAQREFKRAIEIDPAYTTAHQWYSLHLITTGRSAEAITEIRTAQRLDPKSLVLNTDTALVLFYARKYDEAMAECQRALQADASFGLAHRTLGAIYAAKHMPHEAIAEFALASKLLGTDPWIIAETGRSYAMLGDYKQALLKLQQLEQLSRRRFVPPIAFALLTAALQDRHDESFRWLEKEYDQHSNVAVLAVHPGFDPIRRDPRFQQILQRIGLP